MGADLQIDERMGFQRRTWRAERAGWAAMALVLAAALGGLFGPGPLSHSRATSEDGRVRVEYLRFARAGGVSDLVATVDASLIRDGELALTLNRAFLESAEIEHVTPQPASEDVGPDGITFSFSTSSSREPVSVTFSLRPQAMGSVRAVVRVPGGPVVGVPQFYYP